MKKALSVIMALILCIALAAPALADAIISDYGEQQMNGFMNLSGISMFGITFEAIRTEIAPIAFYSEETGITIVDNCYIITVKPGSKVTVDDPKNDNIAGITAYKVLEDGSYEKYPDGVLATIMSGSIDDWPLGKSLLGNGDTVGLLELSGFDTKYVRLGESEAEAPIAPAPDEPNENALEVKIQFTDVAEGEWYYDYVTELAMAGIINGMGDGTFLPNGTLTWAQAMKLLLCAHADLAGVTGAGWAETAMSKAVELGLCDASQDGAANISRLDFCKAAAKLFEVTGTAKAFPDCDDADVLALVGLGVINGYAEDNTFRPGNPLTRAQISKIIWLLMK